MHTKGEWEKEGNKIKVFGAGTIAICPSPTDNEGVLEFVANAHLIVSAVNACAKVNLDNPLAVAESISDLYEALKFAVNQIEEFKKVYTIAGYLPHYAFLNTAIWEMEQALAKAEGG